MADGDHDPSPEVSPPPPAHASTTRSKTRSPSALRLKESFNGIVHRVKDVISPPPDSSFTSRGRTTDQKHTTASTGRGGAGNMVSSKSRDRAMVSVCEDQYEGDKILRKYADAPRSSGRGGAGNIRSPSRDLTKRASDERRLREIEREEKEIEACYVDRPKNEPVHFGRGGAGNIIH